MRNGRRPMTDAVVNREILVEAIEEQEGLECNEIIEDELILVNYLRDEINKLCGKLGLAGASPDILRSLVFDLGRLLGVTAGAVRLGYRTLLDDLIAETFESAREDLQAPHSPPDPDGGDVSSTDGGEADT